MKNVRFMTNQFCQVDNNKKNVPRRETIILLLCSVFTLVTIVAFGYWEMQEDKRPLVSARFMDHGDGTVTDNTTGLIWLKNANCFGNINWYEAMTAVVDLAHGKYGLADDSSQGDWRLPEKAELLTLLDERYDYPALSNSAGTDQWREGDPFSDVQSGPYWSATAYENYSDAAWLVVFSQGYMLYYTNESYAGKKGNASVWPVRGGQ
jgi:hypothetical protein